MTPGGYPGVFVSMTLYMDLWGYIPAGLRPIVPMSVYSVKQIRQNTPVK